MGVRVFHQSLMEGYRLARYPIPTAIHPMYPCQRMGYASLFMGGPPLIKCCRAHKHNWASREHGLPGDGDTEWEAQMRRKHLGRAFKCGKGQRSRSVKRIEGPMVDIAIFNAVPSGEFGEATRATRSPYVGVEEEKVYPQGEYY